MIFFLATVVAVASAFPSMSGAIDPAVQKLATSAAQLFGSAVGNQAAQCSPACPFLLRQAHVKQHGCLVGSLIVNKGLPASLAQGVFDVAAQGTDTFKVLTRFSNGKGNGFTPGYPIADDSGFDVRALAVKIFGVKGAKLREPAAITTDLIAITSEVLFMDDDLSIAMPFFQAAEKNSTLAFGFFLAQHPILSARLVKFAFTGSVHQLTQTTFYTVAPLSLGSVPAKFRFSPCSTNYKLPNPDTTSDNLLRNNLEEYFDVLGLNACWNVSAQLYVDDQTTPIDDLSQKWPVPWHDLALLIVDAQAWGSDVQEQMCSEVAMHPFNVPASMQPRGWIQTVRAAVYGTEQTLRRTIAGVPNPSNDWNLTDLNAYIAAAP